MTDVHSPFGTYANIGHWKLKFQHLLANRSIPGLIRGYIRDFPQSLVSDVEIEGVKFRCYPGQNCHDQQFFNKTIFDNECEEFNFMLAKAENAEWVVDVGANTGAICIPLALRAARSVRILAIEPDPVNVSRLRYNAAINGVSNITVAPCAVGDKPGVMRLWRNRSRNAGQNSFHPMKGAKAFVDVEVKPLLDIVGANGLTRVDLLKIDVEGFEDRALMPFFRHAGRTLWPKAVVIEHGASNYWAEDCLAFMLANGYSVSGIAPVNTMLSLQ